MRRGVTVCACALVAASLGWANGASTPAHAAAPIVASTWGDDGTVSVSYAPDPVVGSGQVGGWSFGSIGGWMATWHDSYVGIIPSELPSRALTVDFQGTTVRVAGSVGVGDAERAGFATFAVDSSTGTIDRSGSGGPGPLTFPLPDGPSRATVIDREFIRGLVWIGGTVHSFEARVTSFGVDTTYGTGGIVVFDDGGAAGTPAPTPAAASLDLRPISEAVAAPDGSTLIATSTGAWFHLARFDPDGQRDLDFGDGGDVQIPVTEVGGQLHPTFDGGALLSGNHQIQRLTPAGDLDPAFAGDGSLDLYRREPMAVLPLPDGGFVVVDGAVERYDANGSLLSRRNPPVTPFGSTWPVERVRLLDGSTIRFFVRGFETGWIDLDLGAAASSTPWPPVATVDGGPLNFPSGLVDELPSGIGSVQARIHEPLGTNQRYLRMIRSGVCCPGQALQRDIPLPAGLDPVGVHVRGDWVYVFLMGAGRSFSVMRLDHSLRPDPSFGSGGSVLLTVQFDVRTEFPDGDVLNRELGPGNQIVFRRLDLPSLTVVPVSLRYVPLAAPKQISDTTGTGNLVLPVAGSKKAGVPAGAAAVMVSVEVISPTTTGSIRAVNGTATQPLHDYRRRAGSTGTTSIVRLGPDGTLRLQRSTKVRLRIKVQGWFVAATGATAGRILIDPNGAGGWDQLPGRSPRYTVTDGAGSSFAVVQVTAVSTFAGTGWVRFTGGGRSLQLPVPKLSSTHFMAFVPLDPDGSFRQLTPTGTVATVDVIGRVTGPGSPSGRAGLLVLAGPDTLGLAPPIGSSAGGQWITNVTDWSLTPPGSVALLTISQSMAGQPTNFEGITMLRTHPWSGVADRAVMDRIRSGDRASVQTFEPVYWGELGIWALPMSAPAFQVLGYLLPAVSI